MRTHSVRSTRTCSRGIVATLLLFLSTRTYIRLYKLRVRVLSLVLLRRVRVYTRMHVRMHTRSYHVLRLIFVLLRRKAVYDCPDREHPSNCSGAKDKGIRDEINHGQATNGHKATATTAATKRSRTVMTGK